MRLSASACRASSAARNSERRSWRSRSSSSTSGWVSGEREAGKSDQIDARAVARAVLREGVERFPVAHLDEAAMGIRLLADHRKDLIAERARAQNRLRWHLVDLAPRLERSSGVEAGVYRGRAATRQFWSTFLDAFDRIVVTPEEVISHGENIVVVDRSRLCGRDGVEVEAHNV
jgi:hypothetical protein